MMRTTRCIDHDRNLQFDHPIDWSISVEQPDSGRPGFVTVWSPPAPDGSAGTLVCVALEWHSDGSVGAFAERRLRRDARAEGYSLVARSGGRHLRTSLQAVTATCDLRLNGQAQRKEVLFIEVATNLALTASSICPYESRRLWREGTKQIFSTLRLVDSARPPILNPSGHIGGDLPRGSSLALQRLWLLLNVTAQRLVEVHGKRLEAGTGKGLGLAAYFESRVYLLHELSISMLGCKYPASCYQKVRDALLFAITGQNPNEGDSCASGALARQQEREKLYLTADGHQHQLISKNRILLFGELLTTSGRLQTPEKIELHDVSSAQSEITNAKTIIFQDHFPLTAAFRFSVAHLFRDVDDLDALAIEEVDERFNAGHAEAGEQAGIV